ncbi:hypothetical protein AX768_29915 (plasmid) [Burkholderia sp. PAMC 28687]|nr:MULTISPECIES: AMP-binding protein [Burkholderiaceae]AMM18477.1 hypothetical protein AX768_29915 [Burkholderia sp. PAMC 28687]
MKTIDASLAPTPKWWEHPSCMRRFILDLIVSELTLLRPGGHVAVPSDGSASLRLVEDLAVDSLEMLSVAGALAEALHLHESGIEDFLLVHPSLDDWVEVCQRGLRSYSAKLTFRTSGSTGTAKRCTHSLANLWQEVVELAPLFSERQRILTAVPSHHIYGFIFTILLPHALGISESAVGDLRMSSAASLANLSREGDLIIGHPEYWRSVSRALPSIPSSLQGVTSTAACPAELSDALLGSGLGALTQIYGSSETAGVGWRANAAEPYKLFSYWARAESSPAMFVRTEADNSETDFPCQDALEWVDDRSFYPVGRADGAVQIAGTNVFASNVQRVLMEHPEIADASVRLMRPDEGVRLKAFIVPRDPCGVAELRTSLELWLRDRLTSLEIPKAITFGASLPKNAMGKCMDWIIA